MKISNILKQFNLSASLSEDQGFNIHMNLKNQVFHSSEIMQPLQVLVHSFQSAENDEKFCCVSCGVVSKVNQKVFSKYVNVLKKNNTFKIDETR